jgi:hypothetical protein
MRKFISIFTLIFMTATSHAQGMPPEISKLVDAVSSVKGAANVSIGKMYLPDIEVKNLSLPSPYADLPIATLRRTNGGLSDELLLSINFEIERNEAGLNALEFLSWWVRDQSRGGENLQIRSIGLPPIIGKTRQLGSTLRFTIDWFYIDKSQDINRVLTAIGTKAKELQHEVEAYKDAF